MFFYSILYLYIYHYYYLLIYISFLFDKVKDINWCLNVQSSSSSISKDARPVALLQLSLTGDKTSMLTTEFDKKQLIELYYNLEKIQTQLDVLK